MCGIAGIINIKRECYPNLKRHLRVMNTKQSHRGPDGEGVWTHPQEYIGFGHRRLSIIDLKYGDQPMSDEADNTICFNGEIYNYIELRDQLGQYEFRTNSDTEVILAAYNKWGFDCVKHLRGMFSFAIWDNTKKLLFCARDRFGIKPFYYSQIGDNIYFASEAKAITPFLKEMETNLDALKDYLVFQLYLDGKTLFKNINELQPGHSIIIQNSDVKIQKYWEINYLTDFDHTPEYFEKKLKFLMNDSINMHLRSDVAVGSYLSGGVDSSIISGVASDLYSQTKEQFSVFHGKFTCNNNYDESEFARAQAKKFNMNLFEIDITSNDFIDSISKIIYHLDYPVAGPGSFPQYHVSKLASKHNKVILSGLGGDEIFGGYTRYLIAYFEQCIKGAIDNTLHKGNFIVSYESIIPNLVALKNYIPLLQKFWKDGLFDDIDKRYFNLINRAPELNKEVYFDKLGDYNPFKSYQNIFNANNVKSNSYFDLMSHYDFKTLLPALLHVEDRMSMAHGLESRVPFLDHPVVEFAATMPSNVKFKDGTLKKVLINSMKDDLHESIIDRSDKMGFPVPLTEWMKKDLKEYFLDTFNSRSAKERDYFNSKEIIKNLDKEPKFGRKMWGLLSLELWHQQFQDKFAEDKKLLTEN